MKIPTVSDQAEPLLYDRFQAERFADIDLVLSCGDLPPDYLSFLVTMLNVPLFNVCGTMITASTDITRRDVLI
jgi:hypothetical protein